MNIRDIAKEMIPPILVRSMRLLKHGRKSEALSPIVEVIIPSFSSAEAGSYSQYGEDLVLDAVMGCASKGFFVDIGANDPISLSNTKRFSLRGWTGINVEPNPLSLARIVKDRPHDINLNCGVGSSESSIAFYSIDPDTLSTFNKEIAYRSMTIHKGARIVETINVSVIRLSTLFRRYLPKNTVIDFLSLDVEGGELDVLQGNDWEIYRPMWMMIEVMISGMGIFDFLSAIGYSAVWCNSTNALFLDRTAHHSGKPAFKFKADANYKA